MRHFPVLAVLEPETLRGCIDDAPPKVRQPMRQTQVQRRVNLALEPLLAPYDEGTSDPQYCEFVSCEADAIQRYETGTLPCVRFPDGRICDTCDSAFCSRFLAVDGKIYQRHSGPLRHRQRNRKARKLKLLPEYPVKRLWPSWERFAEDFYGCTYDEEMKAYGYYKNPNAKWDWYVVGGRWPHEFLVRKDCQTVLEAEWPEADPESRMPVAPSGFRWVCGARKADIQWDIMKELAMKRELAHYEQYRSWVERGEITGRVSPLLRLTEVGVEGWDEVLYYKGETQEAYLNRAGLAEKDRFPCWPFALLREDGWQSRGSMGWFGISTKDMEERAWWDTVQTFLDAVPMDAMLVVVDCHI